VSDAEKIDIGPGDGFWFDVVGEASYQGTLWELAARRTLLGETVVFPCLVVAEPENAFDPLALAVVAEGFGKIGYFQRNEASGRYRGLGDMLRERHAVGACEGTLTGGWEQGVSIGVKLSIRTPPSGMAHGKRAFAYRLTSIQVPQGAPSP